MKKILILMVAVLLSLSMAYVGLAQTVPGGTENPTTDDIDPPPPPLPIK